MPQVPERPAAQADYRQLQQCHSQDKWIPATFDHDKYFQLDRDHNKRCVTCHVRNDYSRYTCYGCHEHTPDNIRREHVEEGIRDLRIVSSATAAPTRMTSAASTETMKERKGMTVIDQAPLRPMNPVRQQAILSLAQSAAFANGANDEREREQIRRLAESLGGEPGAANLPQIQQKAIGLDSTRIMAMVRAA